MQRTSAKRFVPIHVSGSLIVSRLLHVLSFVGFVWRLRATDMARLRHETPFCQRIVRTIVSNCPTRGEVRAREWWTMLTLNRVMTGGRHPRRAVRRFFFLRFLFFLDSIARPLPWPLAFRSRLVTPNENVLAGAGVLGRPRTPWGRHRYPTPAYAKALP